MVRVACEHGVQSAGVGRVLAEARVSRDTFYELFSDPSDCLLAAIDRIVAHAGERARAAYETEDGWVEAVRAALLTLLEFFDEEPSLARLCLVQSAALGPSALARRRGLLAQLAQLLHEGSDAAGARLPPLVAEGVVGGVFGAVHGRLLREESATLSELVNPLMGWIVLPYLGFERARIELSRPVGPSSARRRREQTPDPLEHLEIRLTYRTAMVLAAIARAPGLSNAAVSARAGVTDQGQISKLLDRLAGLGLIENTRPRNARSKANAWRLTRRGRAVEAAIGGSLLYRS